MECLYALVDWEDGLSSIISLKSIEESRKEFKSYREGDSVKAKFQGKLYTAEIAVISGNYYINHVSIFLMQIIVSDPS